MLSEPIQQRLRRTASGLLFTAQYHSRMLYLNQRHKMCVTSPLKSETQNENDAHTSSMTALPYDEPLAASFQTAKEKFENASSTSHFATKKNRLEDVAPPAVLPKEEQKHNPPLLPEVYPLNADKCKPASFSATHAVEKNKAVSTSSAWPTAKQRTEDHHIFVGNVPTLPISFTANTTSAPAQSSIANAATVWRTLAKQQNSQHGLTKLQHTRYPRAALFGTGLVALMLIALVIQSSLARQTFHTSQTTHVASAPQQASSGIGNAKLQPTPVQQSTPAPEPTTVSQQTPALEPTPDQQNPTQQPNTSINASKALVRLSQLDPNEYASQSEFNTWAYSACSTTAMTEVFNAYGNHYRITDVLRVESQIGEITPESGLLENSGVARTATKFGFSTQWSDSWTLDQVLHNANQGHPVIVDWPPDRYTDGHVVVVTGGDPKYVYLADSSSWNRHRISRAQFTQWWGGFAAIVTPK